MALFLIFLLLIGFLFSEELVVLSEKLTAVGKKIIAEGNAELFYGDWYVKADRIEFIREEKKLFASGNVIIKNPKRNFEVKGSYAYLNLKKDKGYFLNAEGKFREFNFQAEKIEQLDKDTFKVYEAELTTCPLDKKELYLCIFRANVNKERALVIHNTLRFFKVPIFYLPIYSFPLGGRRTGFLFPTIGSTTYSDLVYIQPFFWAISQDKDMTFYFDYRKNQMKGIGIEYRQAFTEKNGIELLTRFYREDKERGNWWEGRKMHRKNRYSFMLKQRLENLRIKIEEVSDPYFYEDISLKDKERTKPYTVSSITYEREGRLFRTYLRLAKYRDLTSEENNATQLFPDISLFLKHLNVKGFDLSGDFSYTNFYRNKDGSYQRFVLNPFLGRYFEIFSIRNYSSLTLINHYYPDSKAKKLINTYRFNHTIPQYFSVKYRGFKMENFFELGYNYSPRNYTIEIYDYQDEIVKENNVNFTLIGKLKKEREFLSLYMNTGYNLLGSYRFPTDGELIKKKLLPFYYNVSIYPFENVKLWNDGIYDFNRGVWARSVTGINLQVWKVNLGASNTLFKNSKGDRILDQLSGYLNYESDRLIFGITTSYDRIEKKELSRGINMGFKGPCWKLTISYSRRYYSDKEKYLSQIFLRFNIFFKEEIEIPIKR
ncbi:LPS-assembly protein LptD [Aquifex pyrophilus]